MSRRKTREVKIGNVAVGGKNPVRVKAMLKTPVADFDNLYKEACKVKRAGAEVIRIAVRNQKDAVVAKKLKNKGFDIPIVADIHFDYKAATAAIENGFDSIRLNPLNLKKVTEIKKILKLAKEKNISIRIGVNSGGFKKNFKNDLSQAKEMVNAVLDYIKIFEKNRFFDIMVSLKAADVNTTILANRLFSKASNYPLHLGVTATGAFNQAVVKSSIGIGALLADGVGDIIRVSLTAPSDLEVEIAKNILQAVNARIFEPEIISCPTCSRCQVDLAQIVKKFKKSMPKKLDGFPSKIAIMGCVVNGPGEAYQADIGVAFGDKKAAIFKKDKILGWTDDKNVVNDLMSLIKEGTWK